MCTQCGDTREGARVSGWCNHCWRQWIVDFPEYGLPAIFWEVMPLVPIWIELWNAREDEAERQAEVAWRAERRAHGGA